MLYPYVVPTQPIGYSPHRIHLTPAEAPVVQVAEGEDEDEELWEFTHNVKGLTLGVPLRSIENKPQHMQRQMVGVTSACH